MGKSLYYLRDAEKNNTDIQGENLRIIADMLGTTPEYLAGETDDNTPAPREGSGQTQPMNEREQELIRIARKLDPSHQDMLLRIAAAVAYQDILRTSQVPAGVPGP